MTEVESASSKAWSAISTFAIEYLWKALMLLFGFAGAFVGSAQMTSGAVGMFTAAVVVTVVYALVIALGMTLYRKVSALSLGRYARPAYKILCVFAAFVGAISAAGLQSPGGGTGGFLFVYVLTALPVLAVSSLLEYADGDDGAQADIAPN